MEHIMPELAIGIPFLLGIGKFIKSATSADNKWIPLILGIIGVIFAPVYILVFHVIEDVPQAILMGIVQGVILAALAVFGHTVFKTCMGNDHKRWNFSQVNDYGVIFKGEDDTIMTSYDTDLLKQMCEKHNECL